MQKLIFLLLFSALIGGAQTSSPTQPLTQLPDRMAGPWETGGFDGTSDQVGIHLKIDTWAEDSVPKHQSVYLSVYRRHLGHLKGHGFLPNQPDGIALLNGRRLTLDSEQGIVHFGRGTMPDAPSITLDLVFDSEKLKWEGSFGWNNTRKRVVLERPKPLPGSVLSPFVGDWVARKGEDTPGCFHIAQPPAGPLYMWMDRKFRPSKGGGGKTHSNAHYGEIFTVEYASGDSIVLRSTFAGGMPFRFHGLLLLDGTRLDGDWQPVSAEARRGGMGLQAPAILVKATEGECYSGLLQK